MKKKGKMPPVSTNRKAFHDYFIHDTYEAGIVLTGTEVKSIRQGRVNLRDGFVRLSGGEVWLWNAHISPYEQGNRLSVKLPWHPGRNSMISAEILRIEKPRENWTDR